MMSHDGICQLMCPEIGDRDIENAPDWHLLIDPIRWGALHILEQYRMKLRTFAFLSMFWPVILYG